MLTVGGASISGTFGIEQVTTTGGVKRTVLAVSGASVRLSATGPDLLQNVTGALGGAAHRHRGPGLRVDQPGRRAARLGDRAGQLLAERQPHRAQR